MRIAGRLLRLRRRKNPEFWLGNRARDLRRWREAAEHYQKALAVQPERAAIWVQYGHALKESGDLPAAEQAYRRAIALAPALADSHLQLGHALKLQGRPDEAAAAYLDAFERDPQLHAALFELSALGWAAGAAGDALAGRIRVALGSRYSASRRRADPAAAARLLVLDVSDLVDYFQNNRIPTGIQRVQINVAASLLRRDRSDSAVAIASLRWNGQGWTALPEELFLRLADLALAGGERDEPAWRTALSELFLVLVSGEPLAFPEGAILVTLGGVPSSWLRNFFLALRAAKEEYGIRYVPFVHDCIPLLAPHYCSRELTGDFIAWLIAAFDHADGFLVNSQATAGDLARAARRLGRPRPQPAVVPLGACSSSLTGAAPGRLGGDRRVLKQYGLRDAGFVLFVSTIEARKNHAQAFEAWRALLARQGARRTPMLVCIGKPGWRAEPALARLSADAALRRKVLILSNVSDADLAILYRHCLFTLYPSAYEGWGLPITESLCHGKVPLAARISSLPEAGGDLAEYFDPAAPGDLVAGLERLIGDAPARRAREARIRHEFRPRPWSEIAEEIVAGAFARAARAAGRGLPPLPAESGRYYALARNRESRVWPGMICGEMYRAGPGWLAPDERGCRLRQDEAEIAFSLAALGEGAVVVDLGLYAAAAEGTAYRVWLPGGAVGEEGVLAAGEERWIALTLGAEALRAGAVRLRLAADGGTRSGAGTECGRPPAALGVLGFHLCRRQDAAARRRFLDALRAGRLDRLSGPPDEAPGAAASAA